MVIKSIQLDICLDQTVCEAGSDLTGKVTLSVSGNDEIQLANAIRLAIRGRECARTSETTLVKHFDNILNMKILMPTFPTGRISPGYYEYPFQCTLPANVPVSFNANFRGCNKSSCANIYLVSGFFKYFEPQSNALLDCLATNQGVTIVTCTQLQPRIDRSNVVVVEPEVFPVRNWFSSQGSILLGFDTSSTVMVPDSFVGFGISGKNFSVFNIAYLKAELVETISWTAFGPMCTTSRVLAHTNLFAGPAWAPLHISTFGNSRHSHTYPSISALEGSRVHGMLRVPSDTHESFQGQLIQITHTLVITTVVVGIAGQHLANSPQTSIPVQVMQNIQQQNHETSQNSTTLLDIDIDNDDVSVVMKSGDNSLPMALAQVLTPTLSANAAQLSSVSTHLKE